MERKEFIDQQFINSDFENISLIDQEFENCSFKNCNFSASILNGSTFTETVFEGCNFSLTKMKNSSFRKVSFRNCKIIGTHFDECNPFLLEMMFNQSIIELSSFCGLQLKGILFEDCKLIESDFTSANLSSAIFRQTNLERSIFFNTILEKADLSSAYQYSIDPNQNNLKRAKFSYPALLGLLENHGLDII
jgi:fluoroquinolone resistance protein